MKKKLLYFVGLLIFIGLLVFPSLLKDKNENNNVVVYSPHGGDERGTYIIKRAKEETGLDVKFISGGGGALADRLMNEKNNPQADVVMALNQLFMYNLKANDVLKKYVPKWANEVPKEYKDSEGYFYGLGRTPIIIAYNADYFKEKETPKNWLDLNKDEYKGLYTVAPLENQTTRIYILGMLWRFYDSKEKDISSKGWDFLKKIYENADSVENINWDEVKSEKTPIVLDWFGNIKKQAKNYNINIKYVDGDQGTPIVAESISLINNSKNMKNAKKFIEWFGSAEFMAEYADKFFEFGQVPLNEKAISMCNDDIKEASKQFNNQNMDNLTISKQMNGWLKKVELEIMK